MDENAKYDTDVVLKHSLEGGNQPDREPITTLLPQSNSGGQNNESNPTGR